MFNQSALMDEIKERKDTLRLRVHLGSMELRNRWEELEEKWKRLAEQAGVHGASEEVQAAARSLAEELRQGYVKMETALTAARANCDREEQRKDVEALAYRLWEERGRPVGSPEEDWLRAEKILGG